MFDWNKKNEKKKKLNHFVLCLFFWCEAYRAVFQESSPDLHCEASLGTTGDVRVNYGGVNQSGQMCAHSGQMATVGEPYKDRLSHL